MQKAMFFLLHRELKNDVCMFRYTCRHHLFLQRVCKLFEGKAFVYTPFLGLAYRMLWVKDPWGEAGYKREREGSSRRRM